MSIYHGTIHLLHETIQIKPLPASSYMTAQSSYPVTGQHAMISRCQLLRIHMLFRIQYSDRPSIQHLYISQYTDTIRCSYQPGYAVMSIRILFLIHYLENVPKTMHTPCATPLSRQYWYSYSNESRSFFCLTVDIIQCLIHSDHALLTRS